MNANFTRADPAPLPNPHWEPRAPRTVTTLLVARLESADGTDNLCRIRNISAHGMQLETGQPVRPGERISVELRSTLRLEGRIIWAAPGRAGVQFANDIDILRLLAPAGAPELSQPALPRAPRFLADCRVRVGENSRWATARLTNLSQSGARLILDEASSVAQLVSLAIPRLSTRRCAVRWCDECSIGLSFFDLLTYAEMSDWLSLADVRFGAAAG